MPEPQSWRLCPRTDAIFATNSFPRCFDPTAPAKITANRHRGSGRPLSPATPPYMRVRIRRFGGLSGNRANQRRKPELGEVGIGQGTAQSGRVRESPRAVRTPGSRCREVLTDAPFAKLAESSPSAF